MKIHALLVYPNNYYCVCGNDGYGDDIGEIKEISKNGEMVHVNWYQIINVYGKVSMEINGKFVINIIYDKKSEK